jgi:hypothetical protein
VQRFGACCLTVLLDFNSLKMAPLGLYGWVNSYTRVYFLFVATVIQLTHYLTQSIRISSFVVFLIVGLISVATFNNLGPFNYANPAVLWVFYFIVNGAAFFVYVVLQIVLVVNTLDDRWPLGDILFGAAFFLIGQVIMYFFSVAICDQVKHYVDGLFFGTICTLLAVMMVYKYWDSITKEDLEFSVGSKQNVWEVKELLDEDDLQAHPAYGSPPMHPQASPYHEPY